MNHCYLIWMVSNFYLTSNNRIKPTTNAIIEIPIQIMNLRFTNYFALSKINSF